MQANQLKSWQKDYKQLETDLMQGKIQYWHGGIMLTLLKRADAVQLVKDGKAFIISSQAIGTIREDGTLYS